MILKFQGQVWRVYWSYRDRQVQLSKKHIIAYVTKHQRLLKDYWYDTVQTTCVIEHVEGFSLYGPGQTWEGLATVGYGDRFIKAIGRKISMERALAAFPRPFREIFMKTYLETVKLQREKDKYGSTVKTD